MVMVLLSVTHYCLGYLGGSSSGGGGRMYSITGAPMRFTLEFRSILLSGGTISELFIFQFAKTHFDNILFYHCAKLLIDGAVQFLLFLCQIARG